MSFEILEKQPHLKQSEFKKHCLPLYAGEIACGLFGIADDFSENYLSLDEKFMSNKESTFFIRAGGDSMNHEIKAGDILIVDRSIKLTNGQVGAFFYNGHAICKQFQKHPSGQIILHSFNEKYQDIIISEDDQLELFGVVIGLARDFF